MAHSHHGHREHQVAHRRVGHILKDEPSGAKKHADGGAFSKVTSKSAAESHDSKVAGQSSPKRYARGGKVKGSTTNIAIVLPGAGKGAPGAGPAGALAAAPPMPPMGGPGGPGGPGPMAPPPGMPPGLPMRASGGRVKKASGGSIDGEDTEADQKAWSKRAKDNSYFRGGAATGVGRQEKAERMKRK